MCSDTLNIIIIILHLRLLFLGSFHVGISSISAGNKGSQNFSSKRDPNCTKHILSLRGKVPALSAYVYLSTLH